MRGTKAKALRKAGVRSGPVRRTAETATPSRLVACPKCGRTMTCEVESIGRRCKRCARRDANRVAS